ncbi:hypothetical protein BCR35DRAFT_298785 [Leucosporidium creatinivorum]|uniref:BHLH domain-containing protein n=1 Tax=Leucosporidium creatinivorum TaxID=106004 RepID=A0A1Y2G2H8_9BASI|nr:hypothetical protein BCR35DRAFT_298785 [Leucosporidium creatinivorum]
MQEQMAGPPPHVRLPPVHMPREDQLQPSHGFNNMRRPSLSDPFLHAYTPSQSQEGMPAGEYAAGARRGSPSEGVPPHAATAVKGELSRPGSPTDGGASRYPGPGAAYEFNSPSYNGQQHPSGFAQPAPQSNYRFGGPPLPAPSQDATSYFDYSMRRHSLTTNNNSHSHPSNPNSPSRLASVDAHPTPPPTSGVKRKPSAEDTILEGAEQGYPYPPPTSNAHLAQGAYSKRRGSSLTYDKLGNLSLSDQARRDSGMSSGGLSPWEDDRRGSNGSWTSVGSQGYAMSSYAMPGDPYDQRGQHPPQAMSGYGSPHSRQPSDQQQQPPFYDASRGSMAPPASQHESQMSYGRRPSIGIDQLVQGPNIGYGAPPPMPSHQTQPYPRGLTQPAGMLPSVTHSPPDDQDPRPHSSSSSVHHAPPPPSSYPGHGPPPGTWARANSLPNNSLVNHPPPQVPRHASTGSLDPNIAYGPGGVLKDSPYSRSPELRVTHKLAERKRRKEMAQLFDDLKDSLPVDRGLKSSKWEILSKSIEYIAQLKAHNQELLNDNNMLRDHFGLGPGPVAPSGGFDGPPTAHHGYEPSNQPSESSHSQSSQAGAPYGQPPPQQQQHQDQWQHSAPSQGQAPPPPSLQQQMHQQSSVPQGMSPTASQIKEGSPVVVPAPPSAPTRRSPRMSRSASKNGSMGGAAGDGGESGQGMEE